MSRAVTSWVWVGIVVLAAAPAWAVETDGGAVTPEASEPLAVSAAPPVEIEEAAAPARISMDFQDANLKDVLKSFSQQTGINLIAGAEVSDQPVTLYLEDVTVIDALDQILSAAKLTYARQPGSDIYIVRPKSPEEAGDVTITRVYRLRYARVSATTLAKAAAAFAARTPFEAGAGSGGGQNFASAGGAGPGGGQAGMVGIDTVMERLLTARGKVIVDGRTNSLILTDVPENFPRLEAALAALDVRSPQIMVDAEVIETSLTKAKELGVKWGTGSTGTLFKFTPAKATTKAPFKSLFGESLFGVHGQSSTAETQITLGTLDAAQAVALLEALESDKDTKVLARPKVLTLDNESALIRLTADETVGFTSGSQATTETVTSEPERTSTGVVLVVTPQVNDAGYITMLVEPVVTKTVASNVTPPTGQATTRDPKTRSVRTLVRIRDGDTLVVGGLIDRTEEKTLRQVPILSGIPFVGEAFKHTEIANVASELIVFLTPRILDEPSAAKVASTFPGALGPREQEPTGARQETMEQTLNQLEQTGSP